jgi:ribosome biogenesis GTPase
MRGTVASGANNLFSVLCEDGERRLCAIKGKRIRDCAGVYNAIAAGDEVEVAASEEPGRGLIAALLPRRNVFGRYNEKGRADQAIAANVDLVVCVSSPSLPPFRPRFVDRVAILAEDARVPLLVALNKADLGIGDDALARLVLYEELGYAYLTCSAATGEGLEDLVAAIRGRTSVLVGQSGVGKSSLLNAIAPGVERRVGQVSTKYARGRHTTTMSELLEIEGSSRVIDTPGVRRLALRGIDPTTLDAYFPELRPLAPSCDFGLSCTHTDESGCRIRRAVEEGEVHEDRYESYLRVRWELEANSSHPAKEGRSAPRSSSSGVRRGDGARKTARAFGRLKNEGEDD